MSKEIRSIDLDAVFADTQTTQGVTEPRVAQATEAAIPAQSIGVDQLVPLLVAFMEDRNNRPPAPTIITNRSHEGHDRRRMGLGGAIAGIVAVAAITGGAMYVFDKDVRDAVKDKMGIPSETEVDLASGGGGSGHVLQSLVSGNEIGSNSGETCGVRSGVRVCVNAIDTITTQNERNEPETAVLLDLALYDINGNKITDAVESELMLEELLKDDDFYAEFNQYLCERTGKVDNQLVAYLFQNQTTPEKAGRLGDCL